MDSELPSPQPRKDRKGRQIAAKLDKLSGKLGEQSPAPQPSPPPQQQGQPAAPQATGLQPPPHEP